ncbi:MAG: glycosyltransferase family 4 protein [Acidobacteriota bacterium]
MKPIKVLHVIGGGEIGGAERHVLMLLELLDQDHFQTELLCLCQGPFAELTRNQGIPTHEIVMKHKLDLNTVEPIRQLIRTNEYDLIHTHGTRANLVARMAAKKENKPVVTTFHSVLRFDYQSRWEAFTAKLLTRLTNNKSDHFIAISQAIKQDLYEMGIKPNQMDVIYNGLDTSRLTPESTPGEVRKAFNIPSGRFTIGSIGRLHPVKGHSYLLLAVKELTVRFPDILLLLVGEGPERQALEEQVYELEIERNVIMTGFYPNVSDIYPVIDLLCLPSIMEGMGLVLLEAMYFGVPVVATKVGGIPEVVINGEDGLLVPPADHLALAQAIEQIMSDPNIAVSIVANGHQRVDEFRVEKMAQQTENVYRKTLEKTGIIS